MYRRSLPSTLLSAFLLLGSVPAYAEPGGVEPPAYRATIDEALSEYDAGHYEEARALFERAHALAPNARTLRGRGMAEFELRHYAACVQLLNEALSSSLKPLDGKLRTDTEALLQRARTFVAAITLQVNPPSAQVSLDGLPPEALRDEPFYLDIGPHSLTALAPGLRSETLKLAVHGGEERTLSMSLTPDVTPDNPTAASPSPARDEPRRAWYKSPWLWAGVGVVVAGGATGAAVAATRNTGSEDAYGGTAGALLGAP